MCWLLSLCTCLELQCFISHDSSYVHCRLASHISAIRTWSMATLMEIEQYRCKRIRWPLKILYVHEDVNMLRHPCWKADCCRNFHHFHKYGYLLSNSELNRKSTTSCLCTNYGGNPWLHINYTVSQSYTVQAAQAVHMYCAAMWIPTVIDVCTGGCIVISTSFSWNTSPSVRLCLAAAIDFHATLPPPADPRPLSSLPPPHSPPFTRLLWHSFSVVV